MRDGRAAGVRGGAVVAKVQTRRTISISGTTYDEVRAHCEAGGESMSQYVEGLFAADKVLCLLPQTGSDAAMEREIVRRILAVCRADTFDPAADVLTDQLWNLAYAYAARLGSATPDPAVHELRAQYDADRARTAPTATATARPAAPKSAPVVATATVAPTPRVPLPAESKIVAGPPPEQTAFLGRVETPPGPLRAVQVSTPSRWHAQAHGHAQAAIARRDAKVEPVAVRSGFEPKASVEQARPRSGGRVGPPVEGRGPVNVVLL